MEKARQPGRPPVRADHVGSLLRPAALRKAFRDRASGAIDAATFGAIQDDAIRAIVRFQEEVGLGVVNDGEFRRGSYWGRFVELTEGLGVAESRFRFRDDGGAESDFTAPAVTARVRRAAAIAADEVRFVRPLTDRIVKATLPAPSTMHFWRGSAYAAPGLYGDPAAFFADLAAVYRAEIAALVAAGADYVQFDEVAIAMLCDPAVRAMVAADGLDPDGLVDLYIDAINAALEGAPDSAVYALHLCRGNHKGQHLAAGAYDPVAERLFQRAGVNHFLLEYDTPRAGDFAALRFVPRHRGVVLGVVSSKVAAPEPLDRLRHRVDEAARHVDLDRLAISPQCGFASTVGGNPVTDADMRAKLSLCVEAADVIWDG
ncbi:MAG: cobalamin-independent methionine synthase II family protein [Rhodospirillales bacterium]|nr:MAG: cobalamin-independent methionine synthase II family protein [Rhodospirillales bacterium]